MEQARINHHDYNRKHKFPNLESKINKHVVNLNPSKYDETPKPYKHKNYISKEKKVDIFTYNEVMAEAIRKRFFPESNLRHFVDADSCYSFQKIYCEQPTRLAKWLNIYVIENNAFEGISPMSMISVSGGYEMRCSVDGVFLKLVQTDLEKGDANNPFNFGTD